MQSGNLPVLLRVATCGLIVAACTGDIAGRHGPAPFDGDEQGGRAADDLSGGGGIEVPPAPQRLAPGPLPLRRLSRFEYDNTVRDLLGITDKPGAALPPEALGPSGFRQGLEIPELAARAFSEIAESVARKALPHANALLSCAPAVGDRDCAADFVTTFGRRAFRRPLEAEERAALLALYDRARGELGYDFLEALRVLLTAFLQAPQFLYHWELGPEAVAADGGATPLGGFGLASRLSYFLWGSMPDDELLDAAAAGRLSSREELRATAARMLADARARDAVADLFGQIVFFDDVLTREKDEKQFPTWTKALRAALHEESRRFVGHVVLDGDARVATLLTAPFSFLDAALAQHYEIPTEGPGFTMVPLPDDRRGGLLTQGAFLAAESAAADGALATPIKRGKVIRERILCQVVPPPPGNIEPKGVDVDGTVRNKLAVHTEDQGCAACHSLMDPLGFALESYDAVGRFRTTESGHTIDPSGTLVGVADEPHFADAGDLARLLATSDEVQACFAAHVLRYALGRAIPEDWGARWLARLRADGQADDGLSVRAAILELVIVEAFTHRTLVNEEVQP